MTDQELLSAVDTAKMRMTIAENSDAYGMADTISRLSSEYYDVLSLARSRGLVS